MGKYSLPIRIASFLFLIGTILFIYFYGTPKTSIVSAKYFLFVTPPGLFFTIWAVIFTLQIITNLINLFQNRWTPYEHLILAINNILLIIWTAVFNIGNDPAVYFSFLILLTIIPVTLVFWRRAGQLVPINWFTYFARNSYAFYLGWIVAATNLNLGMIIVYWWQASYKT